MCTVQAAQAKGSRQAFHCRRIKEIAWCRVCAALAPATCRGSSEPTSTPEPAQASTWPQTQSYKRGRQQAQDWRALERQEQQTLQHLSALRARQARIGESDSKHICGANAIPTCRVFIVKHICGADGPPTPLCPSTASLALTGAGPRDHTWLLLFSAVAALDGAGDGFAAVGRAGRATQPSSPMTPAGAESLPRQLTKTFARVRSWNSVMPLSTRGTSSAVACTAAAAVSIQHLLRQPTSCRSPALPHTAQLPRLCCNTQHNWSACPLVTAYTHCAVGRAVAHHELAHVLSV